MLMIFQGQSLPSIAVLKYGKTMRTSEVYLGLMLSSASSQQKFKALAVDYVSDPVELQL